VLLWKGSLELCSAFSPGAWASLTQPGCGTAL